MTPPARTDDVPDTDRCADWHANRWLTDHGHQPETACNCCNETEES